MPRRVYARYKLLGAVCFVCWAGQLAAQPPTHHDPASCGVCAHCQAQRGSGVFNRPFYLGHFFHNWHRARRAYYNATDFEPPFGMATRGMLATQVDIGNSERMALYHYDFQPLDSEHPELVNYHGKRRLTQLATLLTTQGAELKIQPTGYAELDEARRVSVIEALAELNIPLAPEAVVTRDAGSLPLYGDEAVILHERLLKSVTSGGDSGGGSQNGNGGTGAATAVAIPINSTPTQ